MKIILYVLGVLTVVVGLGAAIDAYDFNFGAKAKDMERARNESYQQHVREKETEEALSKAIWNNCYSAIRAKADVETLRVEWATNSGKVPTDGGWRADLNAQDSTGIVYVSCYTDRSGKFIKMVMQ